MFHYFTIKFHFSFFASFRLFLLQIFLLHFTLVIFASKQNKEKRNSRQFFIFFAFIHFFCFFSFFRFFHFFHFFSFFCCFFCFKFSLRFDLVIFASKRNKAKRSSSLFFRFFHFFRFFLLFSAVLL